METTKISYTPSPINEFGFGRLLGYLALAAGSLYAYTQWYVIAIKNFSLGQYSFLIVGILFVWWFILSIGDILKSKKQKDILENIREDQKQIILTDSEFSFPAIHEKEIQTFTIPYAAFDKVYHKNDEGVESIVVYLDPTKDAYTSNKDNFGKKGRHERSLYDFESEEDAYMFENILRNHRNQM